MEKTEPFQLAEAFVNYTSVPVFLTGKAGTGKTTFLKHIIDTTPKNAVVVAPTGVAAINARGTTIHSLFQLPFGAFSPNYSGGWGGQVHTPASLTKNIRINSSKRKLLRELELLIIDEISMVRADLLDAIDTVLRYVRQIEEPFGGVQLLMIGDLYQLSPVVTDKDKATIESDYETPFFFSSQVFKEQSVTTIELQTIYRQDDEYFIQLLNSVRGNNVSEEELLWINERYNPEFNSSENEGYITLTTHNARAENMNKTALDQLGAKSMKYRAEVSGDFNEKAYPVLAELELKERAQVIFMKNDPNEPKRYYNGKLGVVSGLSPESVFVRFPEEGTEIQVEREAWKNVSYKYSDEKNEIEEVELGSFTQYPLKLAWAITIHKSQGLTFEKAVVDAGASFSPGQVYVALSRLQSAEGLVLKSPISYQSILSDERVTSFSRRAQNVDRLQQVLEQEQKVYVEKVLAKSFYWNALEDQFQEHYEYVATAKVGFQDTAQANIVEWRRIVRIHVTIAQKFAIQLNNLLYVGESAAAELEERVVKAYQYFYKEITEQLEKPIELHLKEVKGKKGAKKYQKSLVLLLEKLKLKKHQLEQAQLLASGLVKGKDASGLLEEMTQQKREAMKTISQESKAKKNEGDSKSYSLELLKSGLSIAKIAIERDLTPGTVEGHLAVFVRSGDLDIYDMIEKEKVERIAEVVKRNPEERLTAMKGELGDDVSYGEVRAVSYYLELLKEKAK
ncbi:MAG: helix-turn-helix domain-containing protein [Cyclobacteriaceae bacterium]